MKKSELKTLIKEQILKENPTYVKPVFGDGRPPQFFPQGQWTITNNFKVSPGGGWSMGFNKGELLRSDGKGKLEISNDKGKTWILRRPPIQDTYTMDFHRYGRNPEERQMWNSIAQNISFKSLKEWSILPPNYKSTDTFVNSPEDEKWGDKINSFVEGDLGLNSKDISGFGQNKKYVMFAVESDGEEHHFALDKSNGKIEEI